MDQKQKIGGDVVVYVAGGQRLNATVIQSQIIAINGEDEEQLILSVPVPAKFSRVMSGQQIQDAFQVLHGVRPLDKTKPEVEGAGQGTGWLNPEDASSDPEVLKDGPLLKDLVSEINAGNPIDAYGKDLKDNDKFRAAATHLGVALTPYNKDDVHAQIVRQLQHEGIKPNYSGKPDSDSNGPVASPEVAVGESGKSDGGESQESIAQEREAQYDPSKASANPVPYSPAIEQDQMPQATQDAIDRGELDPVAMNAKPEEHPEFGTAALAEPDAQVARGEYETDDKGDDDRE